MIFYHHITDFTITLVCCYDFQQNKCCGLDSYKDFEKSENWKRVIQNKFLKVIYVDITNV